MSRYKIVEEGPKRERQHCVFDVLEGRVIVRYANKKDAETLIKRYEAVTSANE